MLKKHRKELIPYAKKYIFDSVNTNAKLEERKNFIKRKEFLALIAYRNKRPVGTALYFQSHGDTSDDSLFEIGDVTHLVDGEVFLRTLAILPSAQKRGLSRHLIFGITRFQKNIKQITLHTDKRDNINACQAYNHLGFRIYQEERLKHPYPRDQYFRWINWKNTIPKQLGIPGRPFMVFLQELETCL